MNVLIAAKDFISLAETWAMTILDGAGDDPLSSDENLFSDMTRFPVFDVFCDTFALSTGEAELVALLFAASQSPDVARAIRRISPHSEARGVPTWLALQALPRASASDLSNSATLRLMECIEVEQGVLPVEAHLRLSIAVVDRLCGTLPKDPLVAPYMTILPATDGKVDEEATAHFARSLSIRNNEGLSPLLLAGTENAEGVAAVLSSLSLNAWRLFAEDIPEDQQLRDRLARSWSREAALDNHVLLVATNAMFSKTRVSDFIDRVMGHVVLIGQAPSLTPRRGVSLALYEDRQEDRIVRLWQNALGTAATRKVGPRLEAISRHFALRPAEITALCRDVKSRIQNAEDTPDAAQQLWHAAARVVGPESVPGVELVEPAYDWSDIVLPEVIEQRLRRIEAHVRHSGQVMDDWGFASRMGGRGRGISALLSGQSGTGKSMAAEVLASALDLRVMFIDLSQLISKYIGDTSKNVAAVFQLAERSGAVMVWNEGDAIWGARGTVGNATDRHVNAEVGDLLQRIENFRGFTIVTTNMRHAIDEAFTRRFRFCLNFPLPTERERLLLWQKAFPQAAPIGEVDWAALSRVEMTGGSIRNIALSAAFYAAELGKEINREIIAAEVIEEFRKQDRSAPSIDWGKTSE